MYPESGYCPNEDDGTYEASTFSAEHIDAHSSADHLVREVFDHHGSWYVEKQNICSAEDKQEHQGEVASTFCQKAHTDGGDKRTENDEKFKIYSIGYHSQKRVDERGSTKGYIEHSRLRVVERKVFDQNGQKGSDER